jgi:hypothetical protein
MQYDQVSVTEAHTSEENIPSEGYGILTTARCCVGSGCVTACMWDLVKPSGTVVRVELHPLLAGSPRAALTNWREDSSSILLLEGNIFESASRYVISAESALNKRKIQVMCDQLSND